MGAAALGWVLATAAALAAALAGWAARAGQRERARLELELSEVRAALEEERARLEKRRRAFEERGRELGELRRRLDKTRRRAFDARESTGSLEGRIAELEQRLAQREEREREARLALESAHERLAGRDAELDTLRRQLAAAAPSAQSEDRARESTRVPALEAELRDLTRKLQEAERETTRFRSRERTHRRLYLVIKGELDAARDRLAALGASDEDPRADASAD